LKRDEIYTYTISILPDIYILLPGLHRVFIGFSPGFKQQNSRYSLQNRPPPGFYKRGKRPLLYAEGMKQLFR
jgi:hypothetical protein